MSWVIGGPFLEISLIKYHSGERRTLVDEVIATLINYPELFEISDENKTEEYSKFINDTYIIGENSDSLVHVMKIDLWINICRKRKSSLYINQLANETFLLEFCFYGSNFDSVELNQVGIRESEMSSFRELGKSLKKMLSCELGRCAIEESVVDVFSSENTWPHESYNYKYLKQLKTLELSNEYF